ncbi:MAG: Asp-tRNA(Asn)/Glu-tRNA(Gln) amidotransferase subunit GatB [Candidatus Melainabacteria bacterium]|nr:Asp-tRNA(Asn)/Glu-tRNA(Gln) amidotransferase subunit GatB [Candidatus Melainabacteria bacterium]
MPETISKTKYEVVIGLEVHAQLKTKTKIFCSCPINFGADPNTNVCPVCLGMPGVLPVLNKQVVAYAIKTGLSLNCGIAKHCKFDRKQYFYPDLPKNFQISQYDQPICKNGFLEVNNKKIGIERIHMEEDAGKLVHAGSDRLHGSDYSLVDYNRTGTPLLEIVSKPDLRSADEAREYAQALRSILRYIDVCDGNLEEGSMRCDVNVSLRPEGSQTYGTRCEVKNVNSFRSLIRAVQTEIERQTEILDSGGKVIQETRLFDESSGKTISMRSKEEAHDYRYFPEPDLVPLEIDAKSEIIEELLTQGIDPEEIINQKGLAQITDTGELEKIVKDILDNNPEQVKQLKEGKEKVRGFLVGQVMKKTSGKASPQIVNQLISKLLN